MSHPLEELLFRRQIFLSASVSFPLEALRLLLASSRLLWGCLRLAVAAVRVGRLAYGTTSVTGHCMALEAIQIAQYCTENSFERVYGHFAAEKPSKTIASRAGRRVSSQRYLVSDFKQHFQASTS